MLQSYRVYNCQVNRLSDIVRCSVDCNSFAEILQVVKVCSQMTHILPFLIIEIVAKSHDSLLLHSSGYESLGLRSSERMLLLSSQQRK